MPQHLSAAPDAAGRFGPFGGSYVPETLTFALRQLSDEDVRPQKLNVFKMRALGAEVVTVRTGSRTLRDAINEAMRDWMGSVATTHYVIGSVVGPHPFPVMVRDFQSVIGREARQQCLDQIGRLPDEVVACVGGGSNSAGMFFPFIDD